MEEVSPLKSRKVPIHFWLQVGYIKKKGEKRPRVFLCPCCESSMQHLGGSHEHCGPVLCPVNKADHRTGNGNRLPSSLCQHWGDGTAFQLAEGFTDSTNCSLCTAGAGGQNPLCLLAMPSPQCNCSMKNTVLALCIWSLGPSSLSQPQYFTW